MYLFTRSARLGSGNPVEQAAWAVSITEKVNQIGDLEVQLWSRMFSPGLGTYAWTASVEELTALENVDAKLMADSTYLDLIEQANKWATAEPVDDSLLQLVHADPDAANGQPQYAMSIAAVIAAGNTVQAMEAGVSIALSAKNITGRPTSFAAAQTGQFGGVAWISLYDSLEQLQKAGDDIAADAAFASQVDRMAPLFEPNSTMQLVYRRIA
jgi:hypothetical protein